MNKIKNIKKKLVLTHHGDQRLAERGISKTDIARVIAKGIKGFAGHKNIKVSYKGLEVIYKVDEYGYYVIITAYRYKPTNRLSIYELLQSI